ncbi:aminoacyl-tRNA hydrolase [Methylophaga sp.]|jgi:PTH1 family peptidyl-tRNA hydrolase|uniref:aminoacyl-tRNA hydrolase n=1 Tax=Methylophaga sp. TaxID=2024840 RepID=UPI0013FF3EB8|nr:aminoacyl-tRNA hydrolase [Methylophaga sp.]MTI63548.1 aminoacyl-tRNA hydrolase [Methylophaga sp.]
MASWIIAGLGNPGSQYDGTRHNVGFWLLDQLARDLGTSFTVQKKYHGELAQCDLGEHKLYLLKPLTFMNRSGQSVAPLANFFKIPLQNILVIHDELDLPPGTVRLKRDGGHGGHNGLRDIIAQSGGKDFLRCRLGIGHPGDSRLVSDYVLSKPSPTDREAIEMAIENMLKILPDVLSGNLDKAMNWLHSQ